LDGDGRPSGRDDDIGIFALAIAPATLRDAEQVALDARTLFGTVLDCPPSVGSSGPVTYPGWHEARRTAESHRDGVPLAAPLLAELAGIAEQFGVRPVAGTEAGR
ncbi:MAG: Ldh family oxidoreductase, partial [Kitasatospora sp.]|jgi:LDH2 family malate/lactate/ureidoglycolate dehydrogenase|nr:Ldh family oxidoreductase [Kitasatospora sp.]